MRNLTGIRLEFGRQSLCMTMSRGDSLYLAASAANDPELTSMKHVVFKLPRSYVRYKNKAIRKAVDHLVQDRDFVAQAENWRELPSREKLDHATQLLRVLTESFLSKRQGEVALDSLVVPAQDVLDADSYLGLCYVLSKRGIRELHHSMASENATLGNKETRDFWRMALLGNVCFAHGTNPVDYDSDQVAVKFARSFSVSTGVEHTPLMQDLSNVLTPEECADFWSRMGVSITEP